MSASQQIVDFTYTIAEDDKFSCINMNWVSKGEQKTNFVYHHIKAKQYER